MELSLVLLCFSAFSAGLIDSVTGGGGLIQLPSLMIAYPQGLFAVLAGTNKISSIAGTSAAVIRFSRRVQIPWKLAMYFVIVAFCGSFLGAKAISHFPKDLARPIVLVILMAVLAFTWFQKEFGIERKHSKFHRRRKVFSLLMVALLGFYDGFLGPGTGGFLIFLFVSVLGMDFLESSALAKVVNFSTNLAALCFFVPAGLLLFKVGAFMALSNVLGSFVGVRLASTRGTPFIRRFFMTVMALTLLKVAYDTFL